MLPRPTFSKLWMHISNSHSVSALNMLFSNKRLNFLLLFTDVTQNSKTPELIVVSHILGEKAAIHPAA